MAVNSPYFLSQILRDRFDIIGVDPRGTNFSDNVRCFGGLGDQAAAFAGFRVPFPRGAKYFTAWLTFASDLAIGCSTTGIVLAASMSTAEVARDMDVLRRAVRGDKLTYLGFLYGSYLGQVLANMFPDRFRALVIDGSSTLSLGPVHQRRRTPRSPSG